MLRLLVQPHLVFRAPLSLPTTTLTIRTMVTYDKEVAEMCERSYLTPEIANQRSRTIQALTLAAGETVVDLGCGTGFLARDLALVVGKEGSVLGLDPSADMLALGKERCAGFSQVTLKEGSAENIPVEDNSVDVVTCTQVLLYVQDVSAVLKEIHRVLKPGTGRIGVIETDWRGVVLNTSHDKFSEAVFGAWRAAVPSPNLPPALPNLLREHSFGIVKSEAIPVLNTNFTECTFSGNMFPFLGMQAVQLGRLKPVERQEWLDDLNKKAKQSDFFFCVNRFLFTAVKLA